ncbi:MAG: helix-turn-helix domain-containing protein [Pirellulales bacterium]|nr:helix-turn-helix domain-containing protein [Pirellulales bacterium]
MPEKPDDGRLLLTEREAAQRLALSPKTLYNLRKRGEIAFVRVGAAIRYDVRSLLAWIDRASLTPDR